MIAVRAFFCLTLLTCATALPAQVTTESPRTLRLLFAGDIMGHDSQIQSAQVEKNKLYDYTPCFEFVAPLLEQADLAVGNLELTLPGKPPYQGYPQFRSPNELALALRYAGFDLLVTANNHANDAYAEGVTQTLEALDSYGFYHTGTFRDSQEFAAYYPLLVYKNDFKLAFLNYTYDTNGLPTRPPTIVNQIDEARIEHDMAMARALRPDAIIVVMHWGLEYQRAESESQRRLAGKLIAWGADLIVGSHPHVVQPIKWETAPGPDGAERRIPVAYSLGNFISGQVKEYTDGGILLDVELTKKPNGGPTAVSNCQYIPVWRHVERLADGKRIYRVLPIAPFEENPAAAPGLTQSQKEAMLRFARSTRALLKATGGAERPVLLREIVVAE